MTDKYEEFKEWFMGLESIPTKIDLTEVPIPPHPMYCKLETDRERIFKRFEKEQEEEQKEKHIKNIIADKIYCKTYYDITIGEQAKISRIYNELKELEYLK